MQFACPDLFPLTRLFSGSTNSLEGSFHLKVARKALGMIYGVDDDKFEVILAYARLIYRQLLKFPF